MNSNKQLEFKQTEIGDIPEVWAFEELDKHARIVMGQSPESVFYNSAGEGKLFLQGVRTFGEIYPKYDTWTTHVTKLAKKGAVLLSVRAPVGEVNIADHEVCIGRGLLSINGENNFFIFYLFKAFKDYVLRRETGTVFGAVTLDVISKLKFPFPTIGEQESIAKTFLDFDLKIELNRQMNKTIEVCSQTIFKRWFVDFEFPNEEGKPYKSSGGKIINSSFGKLPFNWELGSLGDICEITMGQSPPGETYNEEGAGVPFFQGIRDFGFRFPSKRVYCTAATRFAEQGDVLLSVRAPVGSLNVADERCAIGRGISAIRLKEKQNGFLYYLLMATRSDWNRYGDKGSVFGSITKHDVHDFKIIKPPKDLRDKFGKLVEPLDAKILLNNVQSRNLAAVRDSLLPKLMSGKIKVPDTRVPLEENRTA